MPLPGGGHRQRLDDQADCRCTYLIAAADFRMTSGGVPAEPGVADPA